MHQYLDLLVLNSKRLSQSSSNQWLLIFDNLDCEFSSSAEDLGAFDVKRDFPEADQGSIPILLDLRVYGD